MKHSKLFSLSTLATTAFFCLVSPLQAATISWQITVTPYIGLAAQGLHAHLPNDLGGNVFKQDFPQGNAFVGVRFNDYVGVEGGYEITPTKKSVTVLSGGSKLFGQIAPSAPPLGPSIQYSKSQLKNWHASLVGFLPLSEHYPFKLLGSVGITRLKVFYFNFNLATPTNTLNPFPTIVTFANNKTVLRLNAGGQYMLSDMLGIRALVGWNNTARLDSLPSKETATNKIQFSNTWNYGLGVFVEF